MYYKATLCLSYFWQFLYCNKGMVVVVGMTVFFIAMLCVFAWLFANEERGLQCAK